MIAAAPSMIPGIEPIPPNTTMHNTSADSRKMNELGFT